MEGESAGCWGRECAKLVCVLKKCLGRVLGCRGKAGGFLRAREEALKSNSVA